MKAIGRWSVASFISVCLGFIWVGISLGLIIGACLISALPFISDPNITVTIPVSFTLDTAEPVRPGPVGFGFEVTKNEQTREGTKGRIESVDGSLKIPRASKPFIAANAVVLMGLAAFALFVVRQLRAVLRTLIHGNPFVPANAAHIRRVAFAVVAVEFARSVIVFAENYYAMTHITIAGLQFDAWPHLNFTVIGYGLIIFVLAEVFRVGTRLDEEQQLTV